MFFRTPRFIRRWLRSRMNPMDVDKAWSGRQKLSVVYMIIAWNAFGLVVYQMSQGNIHWPVTEGIVTPEEQQLGVRPAQQWAKTFGLKKAEVIRISKFHVGEKETILLDEKESVATTAE